MNERTPYLSVFMLSASALGYEILLTRLFAIIQWHHFSYLVIALALLGYGISGTVVTLLQQSLQKHFRQAYLICLLMFSITSTVCFMLAQQMPFNAEEILWDINQPLYLMGIFLILTIPFVFAATAICLAFMRFDTAISRIYAADLTGAGFGSLGIIIILFLVFPETALAVISISGIFAVIVAMHELQISGYQRLSLLVAVAVIVLVMLVSPVHLHISPYKGLQQSLRVTGTTLVDQRSSPLGLISIIDNPVIPLRHAPGLSLMAEQGPPRQLGMFIDADSMTAINNATGDETSMAYLDQLTSALPYHLASLQHVLVVGAGGGADIQQARYHHVPRIDVVELDRQIVDIVREEFANYSGQLFSQRGIDIHIADARDYIRSSNNRYNLIQLAMLDGFNGSSSGLYAMNESYLFTVEAIVDFLKGLDTNGYLVLTRWIRVPPRDTLKLFATAIESLRRIGISNPGEHLVLIRSWQTSTLLIKKTALLQSETESVSAFTRDRAFDIAYIPGIRQEQANRYNRLRQAYFHDAATALLGADSDLFIEQYKFRINPATDDRPYFNHFFKWTTFPEVFQLRGQGGMSLIEWGYLVPVITLVLAILSSVVLILLPLRLISSSQTRQAGVIPKSHVIFYFFLVGLAFLFIEIAFMQKFIVFLNHPLYAISASLAAFLVFAGAGSYFSKTMTARLGLRRSVFFAVAVISVICVIYLAILDPLFSWLATSSPAIRIVLTLLLIAPLAICMGIPFPAALSSVSQHDPHYLPWAWAINGCASVISAILASLLAVHLGFSVVILLAVIMYISILFIFPVAQPVSES